MAQGPGKASAGGSDLARAKEAFQEGDYRNARTLARRALEDPAIAEPSREEALHILESTRIDRGAIAAGVVILVVLAALFAWVFASRP